MTESWLSKGTTMLPMVYPETFPLVLPLLWYGCCPFDSEVYETWRVCLCSDEQRKYCAESV